jgi:hypothetical protein
MSEEVVKYPLTIPATNTWFELMTLVAILTGVLHVNVLGDVLPGVSRKRALVY